MGTLRRGATGAVILFALLVSTLSGCAGFEGSGAYPADTYYAGDYDQDYAPAVEGRVAASQPAPGASMARVDDSLVLAMTADASAPAPVSQNTTSSNTTQESQNTQARMRVFSADLGLSVPSVATARDQIIELVEGVGGYVESSNDTYLVVRVPAATFDQSLSAIEQLGDVLSRAVSTADVTDQYRDLERRLQIVEVSLDRLQQLLERATDPDERVAILRDIRRLTEEKEQIQASMTSLSRLAQYSRITIQLTARIQTTQTALMQIPFSWIASLNPLYVTIGEAERPIEIVVPDDFAQFSEGRTIRAESADGVRLRIGGRQNEPAGDAEFWQDALAYHLGPLYRSVERIEVGSYLGVRLESKDSEPFVFFIAVAIRGDQMLVAEIFYPDTAAEQQHEEALFSALEGAL